MAQRAREVRRGVRRDRLRRDHRHEAVRHHRAVRRLRVRQEPLVRLRPRRVPDRVAQGPPPGRVPRRAAHEREGEPGQGGRVPRRVPAAGHQGARPRRERLVDRLHGARRRRGAAGIALPPGTVGLIPFGLSAVRNVGESLVRQHHRRSGRRTVSFADFYDFCERVDPSVLNKRAIESLIKAGAFDSLGHPRKGLLSVYEQIVDITLARRRERDQGVMSLFGEGDARRRRLRPSGSRSPTSSSTRPSGSSSRRRCSAST